MRSPSPSDYAKLSAQFAENLRARREKMHLSMSETAQRAGLSQQMVSYVERNMRIPTLETMYRLAHALEIPLRDLLPA
jgi:transcriptional regulator with XRE-family HTH domain